MSDMPRLEIPEHSTEASYTVESVEAREKYHLDFCKELLESLLVYSKEHTGTGVLKLKIRIHIEDLERGK